MPVLVLKNPERLPIRRSAQGLSSWVIFFIDFSLKITRAKIIVKMLINILRSLTLKCVKTYKPMGMPKRLPLKRFIRREWIISFRTRKLRANCVQKETRRFKITAVWASKTNNNNGTAIKAKPKPVIPWSKAASKTARDAGTHNKKPGKL